MIKDKTSLVTASVGGLGVLASYGFLASRAPRGDKGGYANSPLWLGLGKGTVVPMIALQGAAALGFLVSVGSWLRSPPTAGLMSRRGVLPATLGLFTASAAAWGVLAAFMNKDGTASKGVKAGMAVALSVTAASTIAMIAGAAEDVPHRSHVTLGLMSLGAVTVLADGVVWNARMLLHS